MKKTKLKSSLVIAILLVFVLSLIMFSNVRATEVVEDTTIAAPDEVGSVDDQANIETVEDQNIDIYEDDLYEAKQEDYVMEKMVNGNAFIICSGKVTIKGQVNGSLYVLAKEVEILSEANVVDAIYVAGTSVKLDAPVYDFYVAAQNFEMGENAYVQRDLRVVSQSSTLFGTVYRNAFISSGTIDCKKDDVNLLVYGNLEYSSKEKIENEETIAPYGNVKFEQAKETEETKTTIGDRIVSLIQKIVFVVIVYVLLTFIAPKFNNKLEDYISSKSIKACLIGLLGLIVIPVVSIILMVTMIGLPLGALLIGMYIILICLSTTVAKIAISNKIAEKIKLDKNIWTKILSIALVVIVIYILRLIPIVSGLVGIITGLLGVGIIISYVFDKIKENKEITE